MEGIKADCWSAGPDWKGSLFPKLELHEKNIQSSSLVAGITIFYNPKLVGSYQPAGPQEVAGVRLVLGAVLKPWGCGLKPHPHPHIPISQVAQSPV